MISSRVNRVLMNVVLLLFNRCKYHPGAVKQGATIDIKCGTGLIGNTVTIQLRGRNYLTLCEVQVFGEPSLGR